MFYRDNLLASRRMLMLKSEAMDQDSLVKFVANMRANGQSDEMIAQSLVNAGHNELVVANLMEVSALDELDYVQHEPQPPADPVAPSPFTVTDAQGNPLITSDNMPKNVGPREQNIASHDVDRSKPPRARQYPSAAARPNPHYQPTPPPAGGPHTYSEHMDVLTSHKEIDAGDHHILPANPKQTSHGDPQTSHHVAQPTPTPPTPHIPEFEPEPKPEENKKDSVVKEEPEKDIHLQAIALSTVVVLFAIALIVLLVPSN